MPNVISLVVVALIAQFMLADQRGVVNVLIQDVGLGNVSWLGSPSLALMTLAYHLYLINIFLKIENPGRAYRLLYHNAPRFFQYDVPG